MSTKEPPIGSFEFFYQPSREALKQVIETVMRYGEEHMYFEENDSS